MHAASEPSRKMRRKARPANLAPGKDLQEEPCQKHLGSSRSIGG